MDFLCNIEKKHALEILFENTFYQLVFRLLCGLIFVSDVNCMKWSGKLQYTTPLQSVDQIHGAVGPKTKC